VEDQQHGDWTYWHPSGDTSYTAHYTNGLKSGLWTYLYKNRSKFKEGSFVDDEKDGLWQTWYEDGTLLMTGLYKKGLEEGEWLNYWDNGKLKNKTTFKAGQMDGDWFSYHENGKLKLSGKYEENLKVGEWIDYFENGKPKDLISYKIVKEKSKIDYGIMKDRVRKESVRDGLSVSYSQKDYGKTEEGNYVEGKKDGQWIAFYPGGRIPAVVSMYKDGELNGTMKQYDRRGNLLQEMDYKDGVKHGRFIVYDKKGKVLIQKKFEFGSEIIEGTKSGQGGFAPK
jgi:antitoxin component YwqK of YwqJK toxin-antitoxin module